MTTAQSASMALAQNDSLPMTVSEGGIGALVFVFVVLFVLYGLVSLMKGAGSRRYRPVSPFSPVAAEPSIAISRLPRELQEPLAPYRRRGVKFLTADEVRRIYDECSKLAEGRTRLYERQAELTKAQTTYELAAAAAKFV